MKRVLFFIFLISSFLNASILKDVEVFQTDDVSLTIEQIKDSKKFKRTKLPFIRHSEDIFFLKLIFDKSEMKEKSYSVEFLTEFNKLQMQEDLSYININQTKVVDQSSDNFKKVIYVKLDDLSRYVNFNVKIYEASEYASLQILIGKLFGISYGIIFAAFLYYMALYLFNRQKSYIYYSLTQLSMLAMIFVITQNADNTSRHSFDFTFLMFFIFSNLFTRTFLNTKEHSPKLDKILFYIMILFILDNITGWLFDFYPLSDNFPSSIFMVFYLIAGVVIYNQGYKPAFFYLLGWSVVICSFLFIEFQIFFTENSFFLRPDYLIHITAPLESLILAFALSYKMKILEEEKLQQQEFLTHQSKLASMGEMIGNIAHQWRQPLTHLSYIMMNLKTAYEKDRLSSEYFEKKTSEATNQLNYMSHTIDDFRNFFKVSKEKEAFLLNQSIDEVLGLLKATFKNHSIEVKFLYEKEVSINSFKGEFLQVLFNILNNAKDEFIKKEIKTPQIIITLEEDSKNKIITIADNAKGIDDTIIDKIFEPYFTTKDKGLGIGLYMSNMIIHKMAGKLSVKNENSGACFKIELLKS